MPALLRATSFSGKEDENSPRMSDTQTLSPPAGEGWWRVIANREKKTLLLGLQPAPGSHKNLQHISNKAGGAQMCRALSS